MLCRVKLDRIFRVVYKRKKPFLVLGYIFYKSLANKLQGKKRNEFDAICKEWNDFLTHKRQKRRRRKMIAVLRAE